MSETKPMTATHTPTPWFVSGVRFRMNGGEWQGINRYDEAIKQDENVALVGYDSRTGAGLADAHFIVEAVNSHEALKEQVAWWEEQGRQHVTRIHELESELASCRECRANLDCLSRGAVPVRDDGAERIREQDALLAQAADILNCTSGLNAMDLGAKITAYRLAQQKAAQPKDTAK